MDFCARASLGEGMIFRRILVGFDGSPASERALVLARALRAQDGSLVAFTVAETHYATHAGMDAVAWDETIRADAVRARESAEHLLAGVPRCHTELGTGYAAPALLRVADRMDCDLISVGAHGHGRLSGILLGSVATRIVHDATCSVLVARGTDVPADFPASIVVGVDSSRVSAEAERLATALATSAGADIRQLEHRVEPLLEASRSADLLVVGSRGLHGLPSVRSVAERLAHESACPVLIVRRAVTRARADGETREPSGLGARPI
jgi:nucleotide-binding universal stress UspA family protein